MSFPPISAPHARVLILGSAPGERSLQMQQYYAHPHNAFWKILADWTGVLPDRDYAERVEGARRCGIAIWDVAQAFEREGSLDSAMRNEETIPLSDFLTRHPRLQAIFLNGGKAFELFQKRVYPCLSEPQQQLPYQRLISTSPAYARLGLEAKRALWHEALKPYLGSSAAGR